MVERMDLIINPERAYTVREVAEILKISRSQVYVMLGIGDLEGFKVRRCTRVGGRNLLNYIEGHRYSPLEKG